MPITVTANYAAQARKNPNVPNVILEVALDSGTVKWGMHTGGFPDVKPIVKSVSSLQNKLDMKSGYSTRGQLTVVIVGRDYFKGLVANNYLKNRRVTQKEGFIAPGYAYADYIGPTYCGKIYDWSRKGDELTITIMDDLVDATIALPVENAAKTQYLDYRGMNPADIMTDILLNRLPIPGTSVNSTQFASERDTWLKGWTFDRVLTDPKAANEHLNDLQQQSNSFLFNDGSQISFKVFAPPLPATSVEVWEDNYEILNGSFTQKGGYQDNFYNRIVVYYNYDESQQDNETNYDAAYIAADAASQGSSEWDEIKSMVIMSKWIRTRTFRIGTSGPETPNITGLKIYHVSSANGTGAGTLTYSHANNTLQYTSPGGSIGAAVKLSKDGRFQVFDADQTKYVRVIATVASLPTADKSDTVTISALNGDALAATLANKLLSRYRDPAATITGEIDINNAAWNGEYIMPTDYKDITSDEACELGAASWTAERVMLTSVRPDPSKHRISIEAIDAAMYLQYGFICPAGYPDWSSATAAEKKYAYIGHSYIW